jgi:Protein of unknown function (DUF3037)
MPYRFSLVRFVPDPARGEYVNIGAIAGDEDNEDWGVRWISNYARARALDARGLLPAAKAFTATLDERLADLEPRSLDSELPTVAWLEGLACDMNNVIQISEPAPVVAESAEAALDLVFERLLVDPARATYRFRKKHQAQAAARKSYRSHHVPDTAVKARARVKSRAYDFEFDFVVHNGQAVQLVQCWSFELPNQAELTEQVKAWAWMAHEIRGNGGRLASEGGLNVPGDLDIAVVYIPPREAGDAAFGEAQSAFIELDVTAAEFDDAGDVGANAAQRLGVGGLAM